MKATVNADTCIGCSLCEGTCPAVFKMEGAIAKVIADPVPSDAQADCETARDNCPVTAITTE